LVFETVYPEQLKIVSDKVVSEVAIQTAAGIVTSIINNRFPGANESETKRQRFRRNEGDIGVGRKE